METKSKPATSWEQWKPKRITAGQVVEILGARVFVIDVLARREGEVRLHYFEGGVKSTEWFNVADIEVVS